MLTCTTCQHEMGDLASYCNRCGSRLPPPDAPLTPDDQELKAELHRENCSRLGHILQKVTVNAGYCVECGVKITIVDKQ